MKIVFILFTNIKGDNKSEKYFVYIVLFVYVTDQIILTIYIIKFGQNEDM